LVVKVINRFEGLHAYSTVIIYRYYHLLTNFAALQFCSFLIVW